MNTTRKVLFAVAAATAAIGVTVILIGPVGATPGSGVSGTIISRGTTNDHVDVQANGSTQIVFRRVTIQPGGFTGLNWPQTRTASHSARRLTLPAK